MSTAEENAAIAAAEVDAADVERQFPFTLKLKHPVEFGSKTITELVFRHGKLGDIKGLKLSHEVPTDHIILIASRMCGQPTKVIEELDVDDAGEVTDIALDFYGRSLGVGRPR